MEGVAEVQLGFPEVQLGAAEVQLEVTEVQLGEPRLLAAAEHGNEQP